MLQPGGNWSQSPSNRGIHSNLCLIGVFAAGSFLTSQSPSNRGIHSNGRADRSVGQVFRLGLNPLLIGASIPTPPHLLRVRRRERPSQSPSNRGIHSNQSTETLSEKLEKRLNPLLIGASIPTINSWQVDPRKWGCLNPLLIGASIPTHLKFTVCQFTAESQSPSNRGIHSNEGHRFYTVDGATLLVSIPF